MKLFGDWYAVSLTSPQNEVVENLQGWVTQDHEEIWCLSDRFIPLADLNTGSDEDLCGSKT